MSLRLRQKELSPIPETTRGYPYPASTGHTRLWEYWQDLATDVDADVAAVEAAVAARGTYAYKLSSESVTSSTTLQDDDDLLVTLPVGTWNVQAFLSISGATAGDFKMAWTFSGTSTTFGRWTLGPSTNTTDINTTSAHLGTHGLGTSISYGTDNALGGAVLESLLLTITAAGILQLQWAQSASSGTATTMNSGSRIVATRVG